MALMALMKRAVATTHRPLCLEIRERRRPCLSFRNSAGTWTVPAQGLDATVTDRYKGASPTSTTRAPALTVEMRPPAGTV